MTPAQYNEYQRQADVIEEEKKRLAELPKQEILDGSKGNDAEKTNSQRFDEFMDLITSSQTEISDEEIEKAARQYTFDEYQKVIDYEKYDTYNDYINGCKWYREQLKKKQ